MTGGPPPGEGQASAAGRIGGMPLGLKLALLAAALSVGVVGAVLLTVRRVAVRDVRGVMLTELRQGQQTWRTMQQQRLALLLSASAVVSTSPTLQAALATITVEASPGGRPRDDLLATVRRETERVFGDLDRDLLLVTDDRGQVLAGASRAGLTWTAADLSRLPAVAHALNDSAPTADSSFGLIQLDGQTVQVGAAAILVGGYPTGVLVLGDRLARIVPFRDSAASALVVTAGEEVLQATRDRALGDVGPRLAGAGDSPDLAPLRIGGEEYLVATLPLGDTQDGRPAALHLLRSVTEALRPLDRALTRSFLVAGLAAMLLAGLGAAVASRSLLAPLSRFVGFLQRPTSPGGPREAYADPQAAVEVRTLIDAYNGQRESITRQHADLARANRELRAQIEERERTEQALRQSEAALRQAQKLEALGRLASGVAHDFNNLLQVISSATHFLREQLGGSAVAEQDLADIEGASQRASTLVRQLLAFSRKQVLQPRVLQLNEVIGGIEPLFRRLTGPNVQLVTSLAPGLSSVRADPGQMEQVVMNLVVNACDAMPEGGTVTIETANVVLEHAYDDRPEAIPGGPAAMLSVTDTGIGMDAETRTRIFEPFFTTKAPGKGTGLGLATVYGIVRQSGGSITVFSEPGKGTTFRVYFPVAAPEQEATAGAAPEGVRGGTETILLAEDEEPVRRQVRRFLEGYGYQVLDAATGLDAMEIALRHEGPIHLLISDLAMPGVSGLELARRLRFERKDLRAILLSGYSPEVVAREVGELHWAVHLPKPVEPAVIARTMREVLDVQV